MISRDEWLAAVAAVSEPVDTSPEAITMADFCEIVGLKPSAAKLRMRALVKANKARRVAKQVRDVTGRPLIVPAYILIKETPDASCRAAVRPDVSQLRAEHDQLPHDRPRKLSRHRAR